MKQPWKLWVNRPHGSTVNNDTNTTIHSTTKQWIYSWDKIYAYTIIWLHMIIIILFSEETMKDTRARESAANCYMMTSSNGNIFRVTGPLCGEFTGHRVHYEVTVVKASMMHSYHKPNWEMKYYPCRFWKDVKTWWRHQMETFSALLAICAGNSPVPGEFPTQRPVTRSFDVYFDMRPNKRLSKQWWGWWFETPSCPLWRHRNDTCQDTSSI